MAFQQIELASGLQIVAETSPHVHTVAAGFLVRTGARDETPDVSGVSHFLEHMAFKGNDQFTADDVNRIFDEIGARYNASTSEEVTMFYAAVLPEYLETAMQMLSCLMRPALRQEDFDLEKNVILEEIGMYADQPAFTCYDNAMATHFAGHALGCSILGTNESIADLTSEAMRRYHQEHYHTGNMTLAVTGNFDIDEFVALAEKHCSVIPRGTPTRNCRPAVAQPRTRMILREGNQQEHLMLMGPAPDATSELRFAAELLAVIVGDDSGSRLYWEIVDPGYAEAAEVSFNEYDGAGAWLSYLCCQPDQVAGNLRRLKAVFEDISRSGVQADELERARNKVASRIVLRGERPMGRLSAVGGNWMYRREYRSVADDLNVVRSIDELSIRRLLDEFPLRMTTTVGVGPLSSDAIPADAVSPSE